MALQPCDECGNLIVVENKKFLSWGKKRQEDMVLCLECKQRELLDITAKVHRYCSMNGIKTTKVSVSELTNHMIIKATE